MPIQELNTYRFKCDRCERKSMEYFKANMDEAVEVIRNVGWQVGAHQEMQDQPPPSDGGVVYDVIVRRLVWVYDDVICGRCLGMLFAEKREAERAKPE